MGRQGSLPLAVMAESTSKALSAQQKSLNLLPKVISDDTIALDYLLGEQREIRVMANTSCYLDQHV